MIVTISNQEDLLAAKARGDLEVYLCGSITITEEIDLTGWHVVLHRTSAYDKIIDGGGRLIFDGTIEDNAKGHQLFEINNVGEWEWTDSNGTPSNNYVEPFLSGVFDNQTRKSYMFGGKADNLTDWYDAHWAMHNSLPPSDGGSFKTVRRSGTIEYDIGVYPMSGTIYHTKGMIWRGNHGKTWGKTTIQAAVNFSGDRTANPFRDERLPETDTTGSSRYLVNSYRANSFHNSDFENGISNIRFACESRATGIRIGGAETSDFSNISIKDALLQSLRIAAGSTVASFRNFDIRRFVSEEDSEEDSAADYLTQSAAIVIEGGCNTLHFDTLKVLHHSRGFRTSGTSPVQNITVTNGNFEKVGLLYDFRIGEIVTGFSFNSVGISQRGYFNSTNGYLAYFAPSEGTNTSFMARNGCIKCFGNRGAFTSDKIFHRGNDINVLGESYGTNTDGVESIVSATKICFTAN